MTEIVKSKSDPYNYKHIVLSNQMSVLLVSDPEAEKSAASMSVDAGSYKDPKEWNGVAHFLEHLLFLGTTKYPDPNFYRDFLSKNGGTSNAYTSMTETNYMFSISNTSFKEALDIFSWFFIEPLMDENFVAKEMQAVISEHAKNIQQDLWRNMELFRRSAHEGTSFQVFGTGNDETLNKPGAREQVLKFYNEYYSSNLMKLVLIGKESLETLESWAIELFSQVKNKNLSSPSFNHETPFDKNNLMNLYKVVPVKDQETLELKWIQEYMQPYYKNPPNRIASFLIGHEGENSLLSLLIDEGLAYELSAGGYDQAKMMSLFSVSIVLTEKGFQNYEKVVSYTFEYIRKLKERGPQKSVFDEIQLINKHKFDFKDKMDPFSYSKTLSSRMHDYPIEDLLIGPFLMEKFDSEQISKFIDSFQLENMRITLRSKSLESECDLTEQFYGIKYKVEPLPEWVFKAFKEPLCQPEKSKKILDIPPPNIFLPKNTEILAIEQNSREVPEKILTSNYTEAWIFQSRAFKSPKGIVFFRVITNDLGFPNLVQTRACLKVWLKLLKNHLRETIYMAQEANLNFSIRPVGNSLNCEVSGFTDSFENYIEVLFQKIGNFFPEDLDKFSTMVAKAIQSQKNECKKWPVRQGHEIVNLMLLSNVNGEAEDFIELYENLSFEEFQWWCRGWLSHLKFEFYFHGNFHKEHVEKIVQKAETTFISSALKKVSSLHLRDVPDVRCVNFKTLNQKIVIQKDVKHEAEENSAIIIGYQIVDQDYQTSVLIRLLINIWDSNFFNTLRTEEQLGYIVWYYTQDYRGVAFVSFQIQSNVKDPIFLANRISQFLTSKKNELPTFTDEKFQEHKAGLLSKMQEKDTNIFNEARRLWPEISRHTLDFQKKENLVEAMKRVTLEQYINFAGEFLDKIESRIEIHYVSKKHSNEYQEKKEEYSKNCQYLQSVQEFKKKFGYFPDFFARF